MNTSNNDTYLDSLLPKQGGYRKLKSFQIARLVYDITFRFCNNYITKRSRTHDQMVQAARSGVQNIAEGSATSATSKKSEIMLTNIARASLEELLLDYEDFLRQNNLYLWSENSNARKDLVAQRCTTVDEVEQWIRKCVEKQISNRQNGQNRQNGHLNTLAATKLYKETNANAAHVLIGVTISLLNRQVKSLVESFENNGGFSERLYQIRTRKRRNQ